MSKFQTELSKALTERERIVSEFRKLIESKERTGVTGQSDGAALQIAELERKVQILQEELLKQNSSHSTEAAAIDKRIHESKSAQQSTQQTMFDLQKETAALLKELNSSLEQVRAEHEALAANYAALSMERITARDLESTRASLRQELEQYISLAIDSQFADHKLSEPSETAGDSYDFATMRQLVVTVLHRLHEARTEGIDWLLEINGARVETASPSFINASFLHWALRWFIPGVQV